MCLGCPVAFNKCFATHFWVKVRKIWGIMNLFQQLHSAERCSFDEEYLPLRNTRDEICFVAIAVN